MQGASARRQIKITHKMPDLAGQQNTLAAGQNITPFLVGTRPHTPPLTHQLATVMPHKGADQHQ